MDWTAMGDPPPTGTLPMKTWRVRLRGKGLERGRFLSDDFLIRLIALEILFSPKQMKFPKLLIGFQTFSFIIEKKRKDVKKGPAESF
jgi:hypothetical protein